jgi:hypothetical protein
MGRFGFATEARNAAFSPPYLNPFFALALGIASLFLSFSHISLPSFVE